MHVVLIGLNHRTAPVALREQVAFDFEQARRATEALRSGLAEEVVILSTCNRSELYLVPTDPDRADSEALERFLTDFFHIAPTTLDGCLYRGHDLAAVEHLFRVAAGLDSMVLGEAEILGQVRQAYRRAVLWGATGPLLDRIFQTAIDTGKRVRAETELGQRPVSVAAVGLQLAHRIFSDFRRLDALVLGAGEMAQQIAEQLAHRGVRRLWIASRQLAHAQQLAQRTGGQALALEEVPALLDQPDVITCSLQTSQTVLGRDALAQVMEHRQNRPLFVLDLGVPRNVDPAAAELYNLYLYNVDDLSEIVEENRRARQREVPRAEAVVAEQLGKFSAWFAVARSDALLEQLHAHLEARRRRLLDRHAAALEQLPPSERTLVETLTQQLLEDWMSAATRNLHHARSWRQKLERIEALRQLFGIDREEP